MSGQEAVNSVDTVHAEEIVDNRRYQKCSYIQKRRLTANAAVTIGNRTCDRLWKLTVLKSQVLGEVPSETNHNQYTIAFSL